MFARQTARDHPSNDCARWRAAAALPAIDTALRVIHAEIAEATRAARPHCIASGRCCHFEAFGHRLYVTGLEAAWVVRQVVAPGVSAPKSAPVDSAPTTVRLIQLRGSAPATEAKSLADVQDALRRGTCPYLIDGLCSIHANRPFGCRTFFCDPAATGWQQSLHERCHARIRELHDEHDVPYAYGDWRHMLAAVIGAEAPDDRASRSHRADEEPR